MQCSRLRVRPTDGSNLLHSSTTSTTIQSAKVPSAILYRRPQAHRFGVCIRRLGDSRCKGCHHELHRGGHFASILCLISTCPRCTYQVHVPFFDVMVQLTLEDPKSRLKPVTFSALLQPMFAKTPEALELIVPELRSWFAYHHLIGIERFYVTLYDDSLLPYVWPFVRAGWVVLYPRTAMQVLSPFLDRMVQNFTLVDRRLSGARALFDWHSDLWVWMADLDEAVDCSGARSPFTLSDIITSRHSMCDVCLYRNLHGFEATHNKALVRDTSVPQHEKYLQWYPEGTIQKCFVRPTRCVFSAAHSCYARRLRGYKVRWNATLHDTVRQRKKEANPNAKRKFKTAQLLKEGHEEVYKMDPGPGAKPRRKGHR